MTPAAAAPSLAKHRAVASETSRSTFLEVSMRAVLLGCLSLILLPGSAAAFDPHEHKLMADFGAALAFEQAPDDLKLPWKDAKGERWVKAIEANDGARWLSRPKATCHSTHENAENIVQKTAIGVWG